MKVNYGNGFSNTTGTTFTCPKAGLYWLFYSVVWNGTTFANFTVQGSNQSPIMSIRRLHTVFNNYDTMSRDKIINLTLYQQLTVSSTYPTYANTTIGSSWGAFLLDNLMSTLVAFEVCSTKLTGNGAFDAIVYNYGNAWNNATQSFTAPVTGIYYFSLSLGVPATTKVWNRFEIGYTDYCDIEIYSILHDGLDVISRGCLLSLNAGNILDITWFYTNGDSSYSQTSFRGFLYSPTHGVKVAWSVHNSGYVTGSGLAMSFPNVYVNVPSTVWQSSTNKVIIPVSGTYYVEMVGQTDSYVSALDPMDMRLTLNSTVTLSRLYFGSMINYVTRSLPIIVHLQASSVLSVAYYNVDVYGDSYDGLSFQGFLLYPD